MKFILTTIILLTTISCSQPIEAPDYDTELCNFRTECRAVTVFEAGPPMGDCDPACSYAIQDFLACDEAHDCDRVCDEENEAVMEACPTWNFYRD